MGDTSVDAAVLADVLAFLDQFEVEDGRGLSQKPSASSPAPQLALEPSASPEKQSSCRKPRKEANAQARNQARLELYRRKKQEMQALRSQVESLSRRLEIMKGCATSSLEASVADALSVTIRRSRVDWKRIAEREKALRMETEQTNVDLKKLVRMQQKWVSDISSQLEFWQGGTIKRGLTDFTPSQGSPFEPLPSKSTYSSALHSLLDKVDQLSEQDPLSVLKNVDWDNAASEMRPSATWSSSFQIPVADPESVGVAWWQAIQTADNLQGILTEEVTMECKHQQEIVKKAVWSVTNCSSDSIRFVGFISFQLKTEPGVRCVLSARGDIFDATGTSLLFRTSAVRVVTPARTKTTPSCLFRAQYSVYDTGISELLRDAPDTIARLKEHVEVGISAWKEKMRLKDQHMRLRFVGL